MNMMRVCAWCDRSLDLRSWASRGLVTAGHRLLGRAWQDLDGIASHGICPLCRMAMRVRMSAPESSLAWRLSERYFTTGSRLAMRRRACPDV